MEHDFHKRPLPGDHEFPRLSLSLVFQMQYSTQSQTSHERQGN
jgi:hypothetical protein